LELYAAAIRQGISAYELRDNQDAPEGIYTKSNPLPFKVEYDGDVSCEIISIDKNGSVYLQGCKVNGKAVNITYGTKQSVCMLNDIDGDGSASLSDEITCGTESFYVMFNENNKITMLAKYNLYVGNKYNGVSDSSLEAPTGIQSELATGATVGDGERPYIQGVLGFSATAYWEDANGNLKPEYGTSYPANVYDENSTLYEYVEKYEEYLKAKGVISAEASLVSLEQATRMLSLPVVPVWTNSTGYWLGFASYDNNGNIGTAYVAFGGLNNVTDYRNAYYYGVRPVVTISVDEI